MGDVPEFVSFKIAFTPFERLKDDEPLKLIPEGVFYRGKRKLEITADILKKVAKNFASGLPRFRVPINLDHSQNGGKVGNILDVKYLPDGPKGAGLYVTDYELTEKGRAAIEENGYDGVSAEIIWDINGGKYQDPETGKTVSNVLVGMALTPKPFFGHKHVAIFSAVPTEESAAFTPYNGAKSFDEYKRYVDEENERSRIDSLQMIYRDLFDNIWADPFMSFDEKGEAVIRLTDEFKQKVMRGDEFTVDAPEDPVDRFMAEDTEEIPADETDEEENMADETAPAVDELKAQLTTMQEELETKTARLSELEEKLAQEEREKRRASLRAEAESFEALPVVIDEYVDIMEGVEPKIHDWVLAQFKAADAAMASTGILDEAGTDREDGGTDAEKFLAAVEAELNETFNGDRSKYSEALAAASMKHPELAEAYRL